MHGRIVQQSRANQLQQLLSVQDGLSKIRRERQERWQRWNWDDDSLRRDAAAVINVIRGI